MNGGDWFLTGFLVGFSVFLCHKMMEATDQAIFMHKSAMHLQARDLGGRSEVKPHQCQQCLKSFSSNHQLVQHIRVHTGEKPYKCSYCDRRFKQLSHVQQHTRLHTGERPYKCHLPDCGRAFIQLSNLQQHLRNHDAQVERAKKPPFPLQHLRKGICHRVQFAHAHVQSKPLYWSFAATRGSDWRTERHVMPALSQGVPRWGSPDGAHEAHP